MLSQLLEDKRRIKRELKELKKSTHIKLKDLNSQLANTKAEIKREKLRSKLKKI
jgi:hypothetical protein